MAEQEKALAETIRRVLARGQYQLDKDGLPYSGLADAVAADLWLEGYRTPHGRIFEYSLIRETDAGDVVLVPPRWNTMEDIFEFLHYNDGMKPDMSIRYRRAEPWETLDAWFWADQFEDYQKERGRIYEQG